MNRCDNALAGRREGYGRGFFVMRRLGGRSGFCTVRIRVGNVHDTATPEQIGDTESHPSLSPSSRFVNVTLHRTHHGRSRLVAAPTGLSVVNASALTARRA